MAPVMHAQQTPVRGACLFDTITSMHHKCRLRDFAPGKNHSFRCCAGWMARWGSCRPTSTGSTPATPDWLTLNPPPGLSQNIGGIGERLKEVTCGYHSDFKQVALGNEKPISNHLTVKGTSTCQNRLFFKSQFCLRFGGIWERGWLWVGRSTTNKPKGVRDMGVARTRLLPFWLLGRCRCAAPALLQTHSALSASSRCNFK